MVGQMKPLDLIAYPLESTFPRGYVLPRDTRIVFRAAERMARAKRFAEAELAAEHWHSVAREAESELRSRLATGNVGVADHYQRINIESAPQTEILHRFATLPHYDEVP